MKDKYLVDMLIQIFSRKGENVFIDFFFRHTVMCSVAMAEFR